MHVSDGQAVRKFCSIFSMEGPSVSSRALNSQFPSTIPIDLSTEVVTVGKKLLEIQHFLVVTTSRAYKFIELFILKIRKNKTIEFSA